MPESLTVPCALRLRREPRQYTRFMVIENIEKANTYFVKGTNVNLTRTMNKLYRCSSWGTYQLFLKEYFCQELPSQTQNTRKSQKSERTEETTQFLPLAHRKAVAHES